MFRIPSKHGDEGVENQSNDEQHLAQSKPEFGLSIPLDGEEVEEAIAKVRPRLENADTSIFSSRI
jgi:hypothetical protein